MTFTIEDLLAAARISGLAVNAAGRAVASVATLDPDGTEFATAFWQVPLSPGAEPLRLTAPRRGDRMLGVLPDGAVLFASKRADPEAAEQPDESEPAALWLLPAGAGEPRQVAGPMAVAGAAVAAGTGAVLLLVAQASGSESVADDREWATARRKAGATGMWFDSYPVRYWDHYLAPRRPRLLLAPSADRIAEARDLTGDVGFALVEVEIAIDDAATVAVSTWREPLPGGDHHSTLVVIKLDTGQRRVLISDPDYDYDSAVISPDGQLVATVRESRATPARPARRELWILPVDGSAGYQLAADLDRWPQSPVFAADGASVLFIADDGGHANIFRVELAAPGQVRRLTASGACSDLARLPEGRWLALQSGLSQPPAVVSVDVGQSDQEPAIVYASPQLELPGRVESVAALAADGTDLQGWLLLPAAASAQHPVPLVVFIHGGPLSSWNGWSWRWQPHLLAARGYAVLLPNPALSTGFGQHMVDRGWDQWGGTPYTDVLALTDAALERRELDANRTAVTGGSYGGYLTNWVIGHTDRFRCAITHAALWDLSQFHGTTDMATFWDQMWSTDRLDPDFFRRWSPSSYLEHIATPTLVIHGERDYRVPIGEGLRMWVELQRQGVDSRLLLFPDENHWILRPGNSRTWYEAFLGWLDQHLLDGPPAHPQHL